MKIIDIFEEITRTGKGSTAVVGWGRGMGHKGHMFLASAVVTKAKEIGADPYFVVSRTVGIDDPIKPEEKLAVYKKVFPSSANIFQVATDEMPDLTRVLRDLNKQGYNKAVVVVGADQVNALSYVKNYNGKADKAGNIPYNFDSLEVIARQEVTSDPSSKEEGPRATPMRQVLLDPSKTDAEKFAVWRDAMNPQLSDTEVRDLMNKAEQRMKNDFAPKAKKVKKESAIAIKSQVSKNFVNGERTPVTEIESLNDMGKSGSQKEISVAVKNWTKSSNRNKPTLIGKFNEFAVMAVSNGDQHFVFVMDTVNNVPAGYSYLSKEGKTWHPDITKISNAYQGKQIGLQAYKLLIKKGYMLRSGNQQSVGGQKLWNELSDTPGILVYAAKPKGGNRFEYSQVEPGAAGQVLADFKLYSNEDDLEKERTKILNHIEAIEDVSNGKVKASESGLALKVVAKTGANPTHVTQIKKLVDAFNKLSSDDLTAVNTFLIAIADKGKRVSKESAGTTNIEKNINEVADQPYRFMLTKKTYSGNWYMFETENGIKMVVSATLDPLPNGTFSTEIAFSEYDAKNMDPTGKGDAFRIFATVGAIVKEFLRSGKSNAEITEIYFTGKTKEPSRIKLYDMIAKNISRFLPNFEFKNTVDQGGEKYYHFKKVAATSEERINTVERRVHSVESLDFSYKFRFDYEDDNMSFYSFKPGAKSKITVTVVNDDKKGIGHVNFERTQDGEEKMTGEHSTSASKVLGTVKKIVALHSKKHPHIKTYKFQADKDEPSRVRAYNTIAKRYGGSVDKTDTSKKYSSFAVPVAMENFADSKGPGRPGESLEEMLKQIKGKWALVSRKDPKKVLQYYKGSGHPSEEWVNKVERRVHSFESAETNINDPWFKAGGFKTFKKSNPVKFQTAKTAGTLDTLEGPVKYEAGYKIMTGPKGEQYPIPPNKFAELYDVGKEGVATPKKIIKWAKLADHDGVVNTSWGEPLNYTAGNDYIVRHGAGDYGVVKKDIFAQTYIKENTVAEAIEDTVKPLVWLDMDGVLADFFGEWAKLDGKDHYKDIGNTEAALQMVREHPTFWIDLDLLPGAKKLIATVIKHYGEYRICSKQLEGDPRCRAGKIAWIKTHLADMPPKEIHIVDEKTPFALDANGNPNILVDDYGKNIVAWKAAGGIAIKYDSNDYDDALKLLVSLSKA